MQAATSKAVGVAAAAVASALLVWYTWKRRSERPQVDCRDGLSPEAVEARACLKRAIARMETLVPPRQSHFRVFCILKYVDTATGRVGYIEGSNAESAFIGGSICAERSAAVQLRLLPRSVSVVAVHLVSDLPEVPITPGVLCREFLLSCCAPETPVWMCCRDGSGMRMATLAELYPCRSVYVRVDVSDVESTARSTLAAVGQQPVSLFADDPERAAQAEALRKEVMQATEKDAHDGVHPVRYAAGVIYNDGSIHVSWQRKGLEYGNTIDPFVSLLPKMQELHRQGGATPRLAMQLDQYGVAHAPFASARSQLMDAVVFADLDILVHTPLNTGGAQAHARLIKVSQLIPDRPDINSIF